MDDVKRLCDRLEASAIVASPLGRAAMREAATALTLAQARIRELEKRADHYGVALMMIRAGCSDPARFAGNILDDKQPIDIDIEDELP